MLEVVGVAVVWGRMDWCVKCSCGSAVRRSKGNICVVIVEITPDQVA